MSSFRSGRPRFRVRLFMVSIGIPALGAGTAGPLPAQGPLFRFDRDLRARPSPGVRPEVLCRALLAGPTESERRSGWTTDLPLGVRLRAFGVENGTARVVFGPGFGRILGPRGRPEEAIEQIVKTLVRHPEIRRVDLFIEDEAGRLRSLASLMESRRKKVPRAASRKGARGGGGPAAGGALSGKRIFVSPGHGYFWHPRLGWTTQRPTIGGLTEDFHTNEIAMRFLIPYLENLGAEVWSARERGEIPIESVGDDGQTGVYKETGSWSTSSFNGWNGGRYRWTGSTRTVTATATWSFGIVKSGRYPVEVFYRAGSNRNPAARYTIRHTGGTTTVLVDQRKNDRRWLHLGDYWFEKGGRAEIVLDNRGPFGVVIADAVRIGAGMGSIPRGGRTSRKPRWKECSRYWIQYNGAPSWVYDTTSGNDHTDDVTARPTFAEWLGADAYVSLHTNAGGGSGTSSYIHNTAPTRGSSALRATVHSRLVADIRSYYDPYWVDRGRFSANFGEVRALKTMPGVLLELAFHDRAGSKDHEALHDPKFRRIAGRAIARGVLRYFAPNAPFPPERPGAFRVTQDGLGGLRLAWEPSTGASSYVIESSPDGKGFLEVAQTSSTSWSTGPLPHGALRSFRVRALNASGRSFPTEVLCAGTSHDRKAEVLLVQGFDRLGKNVKSPENTFDYLRLHGDAIRRAGAFSLGFDAASNEAVKLGRVLLGSYRAVDWASGEESTRDESFDGREQALVAAYLRGGGRLLVSGSEIGWDLDAKGSVVDRNFFRRVLGVRYVRDDANTYSFRPSAGGIFKGLLPGTFDDGTGGTYDVDYPDVIAPADAASAVCLTYGTGSDPAGIQRKVGRSRLVFLGFPLETVTAPDLRAALMERALRFLLGPRPLEGPAEVLRGSGASYSLTFPGHGGELWVLGASTATNPGIPLGVLGILPLKRDALFAASLAHNDPIFQGFAGILDAAGSGKASIRIPNLSALRGLSLYVSGLSLKTKAPFPLTSLLPWLRLRIR